MYQTKGREMCLYIVSINSAEPFRILVWSHFASSVPGQWTSVCHSILLLDYLFEMSSMNNNSNVRIAHYDAPRVVSILDLSAEYLFPLLLVL